VKGAEGVVAQPPPNRCPLGMRVSSPRQGRGAGTPSRLAGRLVLTLVAYAGRMSGKGGKQSFAALDRNDAAISAMLDPKRETGDRDDIMSDVKTR
jgi:hypothetical protein